VRAEPVPNPRGFDFGSSHLEAIGPDGHPVRKLKEQKQVNEQKLGLSDEQKERYFKLPLLSKAND
jgi:hypothetical protein